jgi:phytoene dehydrogenase-like protein
LAVSSAVRFSFGRARRPQFSNRSDPLFELSPPPEYYSADPSQPAAAGRLLSWAFAPFSTSRFGGPLHAGLPHPLRSALRVWLPSRRLTPSEPVPALFHAGGALGIHPSELSPPARYPARFRPEAPTYRFACRCSHRRNDGPARQAAVPGLWPLRESLAVNTRLTHQPLAAPLGFTLLGSASRSLDPAFAGPPLAHFIDTSVPTGAPEYRSTSAWPALP